MILAAYAYWPAVYVAVYLPFVAPRLPTWGHVPVSLVAAAVAGYVVVLLAAGRALDHRRIAVHAVGIAVSVDLLSLVISWLRAPGFGRNIGAVDPWDALTLALHVVAAVACLEAGRALGRLRRARRSVA